MQTDIGNKDIFAKNLKHYLEVNGESQRELADIIGVPYSTMNDWCKARKYPRIDKIERIAKHYSIQKSDLIEDKAQTNPDELSSVMKKMMHNNDFRQLVIAISKMDDDQIQRMLTYFDILK